jgi:nicotinamidase-related amidase
MVKAYIIIDLQNDYFPGGGLPLHEIHEATAKAAQFLEYARSKPEEYFIIHVRHVFPTPDARFFIEGTPGSQINDAVKPKDGETLITKNHPNTFVDTNLKEVLDREGIKELVVSGAMTNVCIQGTVRAGSELGYKVKLLKDAVTTRDWEYDGKTVTYDQVNTTIFALLDFAGYAELLTTEEAIKK